MLSVPNSDFVQQVTLHKLRAHNELSIPTPVPVQQSLQIDFKVMLDVVVVELMGPEPPYPHFAISPSTLPTTYEFPIQPVDSQSEWGKTKAYHPRVESDRTPIIKSGSSPTTDTFSPTTLSTICCSTPPLFSTSNAFSPSIRLISPFSHKRKSIHLTWSDQKSHVTVRRRKFG